ncbi:uncharacterized protein FIBRA_02750 [Fibroporia radiculosa]|uniref:Nudix hydrolase domain-containing protein n=1 Tax=Fibroporia radiculosa TaxID=599839 RepID=J4GN34_9APHY|nr:uncharacterized protein FIBRA_02750 [Fibroporia radiculosa]CCM00710.1 predicted protein [Fibroporia radiculosa]
MATQGPSNLSSQSQSQPQSSHPSSGSQPSRHGHSRQSNTACKSARPPSTKEPRIFSHLSSPAIPDSMWFGSDFMLGAGMVIIQPSSGKLVLLYERQKQYWFLPKGRKDVGESLEQTALREAYEESGFRADFLPVVLAHNAPLPPGSQSKLDDPCTEPFYVSTMAFGPSRRQAQRSPREDGGGEYLTFWYIGQIPADAVCEANTGMPDEQHYESHLLDYEEACSRLYASGMHKWVIVLQVAYKLWEETQEMSQKPTSVHPSGPRSSKASSMSDSSVLKK